MNKVFVKLMTTLSIIGCFYTMNAWASCQVYAEIPDTDHYKITSSNDSTDYKKFVGYFSRSDAPDCSTQYIYIVQKGATDQTVCQMTLSTAHCSGISVFGRPRGDCSLDSASCSVKYGSGNNIYFSIPGAVPYDNVK